MKEVFIKKHWTEDDILFYLHFQDEKAVRQIEISANGKKYLSDENPTDGDSFLYDKSLKDLELENSDFISREDFEMNWNNKN